MAAPWDSATVLGMVRLGWSVAEVRGRNRPGLQLPGPQLKLPPWTDYALPLEMERTPADLCKEAETRLSALARNLGMDAASAGSRSFTTDLGNAADSLATAVAAAGGAAAGTVGDDWAALEKIIYEFDAHIQDTLAMQSVTAAAGYQLGRGLAECFWALDPSKTEDPPQTWASWSFLLGPERCSEIDRLLGRLSAYFHTYTAAAIAGSVQVWKTVAASPDWLKDQDCYPKLYDQIRCWYELILLKQDPTTLVQPYKLVKNYRLVFRTLRGFWFQLLVAGLAAGAVGVFAWLLTKPSFSAGAKTLLAAIGIAGFSYAGIAAKVKNEAQALLTRLKQDAYTDLITEAITTAPPPPRSVKAPKRGLIPPVTAKAKMASIMQARGLTPVTPS